jgi:pimeloyl-ACP methyl ester carboxylesterase
MTTWRTALLTVTLILSGPAIGDTPQHLQKFPQTALAQATRWAPCALDVKNPTDRRAECAFVTVPLDYSKPNAGTYRVFVKRVKATKPATAHVWLLHGGPGASATADLYRLSFGIPAERPDISYYAVDHRGMGGSERLGCPEGIPEDGDVRTKWKACMDHLVRTVGLDRLNQIGTSNAARDIGTLIAKYREPGAKVIVNGLSYGSTLAHRYMQIFPEQADGVALMGIEIGTGTLTYDGKLYDYGTNWDRRMEDAVAKIFERCALAEECARNFDRHPWQVAQEAMAAIYKGHCKELGIEADRIKETFGAISYATTPASLPALISRLQRCNEGDRKFLTAVVDRWYPSMSELGTPTAPNSDAAGNIISASEGISHPRDAAALQKQFSEELTIAFGVEKFYAATQDIWPKYPHDEYFGKWAPRRGPLLMFEGGLDTATPLTQALLVRAQYQGEHQNWMVFPEGYHQLVNRTPTVDGVDCARSLFIQFVDNPKGTLDRGCLAKLQPIVWQDAASARASFGVDDLWNGVLASE